ncbi:MAG: hypothetical protein ACKODA_12010 [Nevskiaceae bacterium]
MSDSPPDQHSVADWLARAARVMPGTQSNLRAGPNAPPPLVLTSGHGARVRDADGREYIDFTLGMGPAILGTPMRSIWMPSSNNCIGCSA